MKKATLFTLNTKKKKGEKITWITSYDYAMAKCAEAAAVDMILVGDSGGMVQLGYETTNPVTMDEMIILAKSVRRGAPNTFIVGDMPQGSYEISNESAVENAMRFVKEAGCDAIKLEGGARVQNRIKAIAESGIVVVGHLGLTPQSAANFGGYRVQGKSLESFEETIEDAIAVQRAGAKLLLLEALPNESSNQVTKNIDIPVLGIGAGKDLDGQLIIAHDSLGYFQGFRPKFAKCFVADVIQDVANELKEIDDIRKHGIETQQDGINYIIIKAIKEYIDQVKNEKFPDESYTYPIKQEELEILRKSKYWKS